MEQSSPLSSKSPYIELFDATIVLCGNYNMTPFEIFKQDAEEVIMLINYLLEKGEEKENSTIKSSKNGETRIRVTEKTATGGWY